MAPANEGGEKMIIGAPAASGTLGPLIPLSIIRIVHGISVEVSIARWCSRPARPS